MSRLTEHERDSATEKWGEKNCKSQNFGKEETN